MLKKELNNEEILEKELRINVERAADVIAKEAAKFALVNRDKKAGTMVCEIGGILLAALIEEGELK